MVHYGLAKLAQDSNPPKGRILLMLLLAVQLTYVIPYWLGLWRLPHYQFFPFALAAFVWLLFLRRSNSTPKWPVVSLVLFGFDALCLGIGIQLNSPWIVTVGLMAWLMAWCLSFQDGTERRSLGYLILLPLMTIRLPLNIDEQAIHWLQRMTTSIASQFLNQLGMLHVRDGDVIQFSGKSFLMAEACSGVQSLFTILFLAALVICLQRRSLVHGILLLVFGFAFAGAMNVARVMTIAVVWELYAYDLSTGLIHEMLGYCCLGIAAALLMSADACLGIVLDRVPDPRRLGATVLFRNPLIVIWNLLLGHKKDLVLSNSKRSENAYAEEPRTLPSGLNLLKPHYWFLFVIGFIDTWLRTRSYRQLMAGFPFMVAVASGLGLLLWLRHGSEDSVIRNYRQGVVEAKQESDLIREEMYLKALCGLRGLEPEYRFQLGLFYIKQGRTQEGLVMIRLLTPEQTTGFAPARLWLVRQALQQDPVLPLEKESIERQLLIVLKQQPENSDVHYLLSQIYFESREFQLAEQHLTEASRLQPELNLQLAVLKRTMQRDPSSIRRCAQLAVKALSGKLEQNPTHHETRIALAEAQRVAGDDAAARATLVAGLQQKDDPTLKKELADFDMMIVDRRLKDSPLHRDACVPVAIAALKLDPSNIAALQIIIQLQGIDASIPEEGLQASVAFWESAVAKDPQNQNLRILLSQLYVIVGNLPTAIETLKPVVDARPELRLPLARLLQQAERTEEADVILQSLCHESLAAMTQNGGDDRAAADYAETLLALGQSNEARIFLLSAMKRDAADSTEADRSNLQAVYGRVCLAEYDRLSGFRSSKLELSGAIHNRVPESADPIILLELLEESLKCNTTTIGAINRLALLSFSEHPAAQDAGRIIRQLRLEGDYGVEVLNKLGMFAILLNKYDTARGYLQQANARSRGVNPMILNNLAIATLRSKVSDPGKALELANQTLEKLPQNPDALSTRGEVYLALERWAEAVADLTDAVKNRPQNAEIHRLLQRAYTGLPDAAMAKDHARKASELEAAQASR